LVPKGIDVGIVQEYDPSVDETLEALHEGLCLLLCLGVEAGVNGQIMKQRELYQQLVSKFPDDERAHNLLGNHFFGQQAYEKAIELAPDNAKRYANLGLTLEAQRHLEEAILNYRKAVELEKDNTQFLLMLSEALQKKGEKEEALSVLEHILVLEPTNHLAREKLMKLKF